MYFQLPKKTSLALLCSAFTLLGYTNAMANTIEATNSEKQAATTVPTIDITSHKDGGKFKFNPANLGKALKLKVNAIEGTFPIQEVQYVITEQFAEGGTKVTNKTTWTAPYSFNFVPSVSPFASTIKVEVVAMDNQAQFSAADVVNINVSHLPALSFGNPSNGEILSFREGTHFNVNTSDEDGWVTEVKYVITSENGFKKRIKTAVYPFNVEFDFPDVLEDYKVVATATDNDGNESAKGKIYIKLVDPTTCILPAWDEALTYYRDDRVVYNGIAYAAKWQTTGQNPEDVFDESYDAWRSEGLCYEEVSGTLAANKGSLLIAPNQAVGSTEVSFEGNSALGNVTIEVYEMATSLLVKTETISTNQKSVKQTLDVSGLRGGVYFVKVRTASLSNTGMLFVK